MTREVIMEGGMHAIMTDRGIDVAEWLDSMVRERIAGRDSDSFTHTEERRAASGRAGTKGNPVLYDRAMFDGSVVTPDGGEWFCHQRIPTNYIIPAPAAGGVVVGWSSPRLLNRGFAPTRLFLMNWEPPRTVYETLKGRRLGDLLDYEPLADARIVHADQASWMDSPMGEVVVEMPVVQVTMTAA